jgi:hypothetical protein
MLITISSDYDTPFRGTREPDQTKPNRSTMTVNIKQRPSKALFMEPGNP